jgi:hypothetical protein
MATEVYKKKEITLQDGTDVLLRPLPIARLRRFMAAWEGMAEVDIEAGEDGFTVLINCAGISLEDTFKKLGKFDTGTRPSAEEQAKGKWLTDEYREYLEEVLDIETIYEILEICGDLKLNDPKLQEAIQNQTLTQ